MTGGGVDGDGWDSFVSYAPADRAWAEWIAWTLEEAGFHVAVQAWDSSRAPWRWSTSTGTPPSSTSCGGYRRNARSWSSTICGYFATHWDCLPESNRPAW
nr:toll/interleukin-1 receptor domain-containing protein [Frankia sp. QA3]